MNCANHPDVPTAAYCQNCGKPLCSACVRSVAEVVLCEPCLMAKVGVGPAAGGAPGGFPPPPGPNPGLATLLGFIPGVGAMYNGQYMKAIVHVLVFVILVAISGSHGIFGILVGTWVLYQVFDANQTAKARRDGLPLPDPFGLNELGHRMGMPQAPASTAWQAPPQGAAWRTTPPTSGAGPGFTPGFTSGPAPGSASGFASGPASSAYAANPGTQPPPYTPVSGAPYGQGYASYGNVPPPIPPIPPIPPGAELEAARREPIGAIVLIGLGMLFLFNTLGILNFDWIDHGWPLLIIGIGVWLFIRRAQSTPGPPQPPPPPASGASATGNDRSNDRFGGGAQ